MGGDDLSRTSARRRRWLAVAALVAVILVVLLARARRTSRGTMSSSGVVLGIPATVSATDVLARVGPTLRGKAPMPSGLCYLRFDTQGGRVGWDGRRTYELELLAAPGELVAVTVLRDGVTEQRHRELDGRTVLPIRIDVPFWGDHAYRIEVELGQGELMPYDFELSGTVCFDALGLEEISTRW